MKKLCIIFLIFILTPIGILCQRDQCKKRSYAGASSFVCVCNSDYCDTVEQVDKIDSNLFYQEFVTSKSALRLDKFKAKFETTAWQDSDLNLTITRSKTYQKIFGFGGAITDAAGLNIFSLSQTSTQSLINSYFGPDGIEYNVIRVPLAGTDFSTRTYSYDDLAGDLDLKKFSLAFEDIKWKIPFIQSAKEVSRKDLKLFASAWTAPPWMKTNNDYKGNGTLIDPPGGVYYQTWANYYLKFFQAYKQNNISFWAVTAQNEPTDGYLYKFSFNAMGFTPETQAEFVTKNLGPTLEQNGFGEIKIMILDDQLLFLPGWAERVFAFRPDEARKYISGIAVHWYLDGFVPPKILDLTHEKFPDKWIFGTEACHALAGFGPAVILGSFERAESYVKDIIQDLNHWVTGWTDWNLALDVKGGPNWAKNFVDSPVIVNKTADEFYKQPMFYGMGHFSKFIAEGSVRVDIQAQGLISKDVYYVALKNEELNQVSLVLLNKGSKDFKYSIFDSESEKYINSVSEAHSIKTIIWFY